MRYAEPMAGRQAAIRAGILALSAFAIATPAFCFASGCSTSDAPVTPADAGDETATPAPTSTLPQTCAARKPKISPAGTSTCNGMPELCGRSYDRVVVPMTHNAMSNADDGWAVPNQTHGIAKQLEDGIRGLMLDVHYFDPESKNNADEHVATATLMDQVELCHASCLLGRARLLDQLCVITDFLDQHPAEVLTIIFESYVTDTDLDGVLREAGIADRAYAHKTGTAWPTLRELIDSDKRIVIFLEQSGVGSNPSSPAYMHSAFIGNIWDTPYTFATQADFSCKLNRGKKGDPLFLLNHWLGAPTSKIEYAREVNVDAVLGPRFNQCTLEATQQPTFIGVDFYEVGDLFAVAKKANGF